MNKIIFLFVSSFLFISCASGPISGNFRNEIINFPENNKIMTMTLGDTLVDIGYKKVGEGITIKGDITFENRINLSAYKWSNKKSSHLYTYRDKDKCYGLFNLNRIIKKNNSFLDGYEDPNILNFVFCIPDSDKAKLNSFGKKSLYLSNCRISLPNTKPKCLSGNSIWGKRLIKNDYLIDLSMSASTTEDNDNGFSQQFIYNGRVNNEIKFIYREFSSNLNRGSFQQEVQYDLNQSNIIGFKELKIEIIEATNQSVTYKVINNFTPKT